MGAKECFLPETVEQHERYGRDGNAKVAMNSYQGQDAERPNCWGRREETVVDRILFFHVEFHCVLGFSFAPIALMLYD
jgi:hypothetical protein